MADTTTGKELVDPKCYGANGTPHDLFRRLRAESPVHWCDMEKIESFWAITKHEDIRYISSHPDLFINEPGINPRLKDNPIEEQTAFDEISGSISQYVDDETITKGFTVVIAPQDDQQDEAIRLMLANVESHTYAGGKGYTIGSYFSRNYAEIICTEYRVLGFFTVVMDEGQLTSE